MQDNVPVVREQREGVLQVPHHLSMLVHSVYERHTEPHPAAHALQRDLTRQLAPPHVLPLGLDPRADPRHPHGEDLDARA